MNGKAKHIFRVRMAGCLAFLVTAPVTFPDPGPGPDFLVQWLKCVAIASPAA